jgi:hypothetical protein
MNKKPDKFVAGHIDVVAIISFRVRTKNVEEESPPPFTEYCKICFTYDDKPVCPMECHMN